MKNIRKDFPYLFKQDKSSPERSLIYFDTAATSQKPIEVINKISHYYAFENAPVHRGIYTNAENATELYQKARATIAKFINAHDDEIVFTKGTTEGINFIASTWANKFLQEGDEIILTEFEHHSNILPWIRLSVEKNIKLKYIPVNANGLIDYDAYLRLLSHKTKLVTFLNCSNAIGTQVDAEFIINNAKEFKAKTLIDVAQSIGHQKIDVQKLQPDFLVFSGHKILGPTGIGVLYINRNIQDYVEPYQVGGGMVFEVDCFNASWLNPPNKYEAGTPAIAQAIGLAEAINYINDKINFEDVKKHESNLCSKLIDGLEKIDSVEILGPLEQLKESGHIVSFISSKMHPHDIAAYLDQYNIAVRAGNHCAQPYFQKLEISGSTRVSFYAYNILEEVDYMLDILKILLK